MGRMKLRKVADGTCAKEKNAVLFYKVLSKLFIYCVQAYMCEDTPIEKNKSNFIFKVDYKGVYVHACVHVHMHVCNVCV